MRKEKGAIGLDLFLFMIIAFILVLCSGIFIYIGVTTTTQLHLTLDNQSTAEINYTKILNETVDYIPTSYYVLRWGSAVLIFFMMLSIFYGSYKVTTKPIYFIPYVIIVFVALILSVIISNAYDDLLQQSDLATVLSSFTASNFFLLYLPVLIGIIGIVGGIIMFGSYSLLNQQEVSLLG